MPTNLPDLVKAYCTEVPSPAVPQQLTMGL